MLRTCYNSGILMVRGSSRFECSLLSPRILQCYIYIYIVVLKTYCNLSAMWGCSYINVYCLFSRIDNYLSHLISHTLLISYITHISYHDISHRTLPSTLTTALLYFLLLRNEKAYRRRILSNN